MYRPNKNLVVASESLPAQYRPSNQARLVPSRSANPSVTAPEDMLPGMGHVRAANGIHSNGLAGGAADKRLIAALVAERAQMLEASGSPSGAARPKMSLPLAQAFAALQTPIVREEYKPKWEHVQTVSRGGNSRWIITKHANGKRYAVALYRTTPKGDDEVVRSDNLASAKDAHEYIRAYEIRRGNGGKRAQFWGNLAKKPTKAAAFDAQARRSMAFQTVKATPFVSSPAPTAPDAYAPAGHSNLTAREQASLSIDGLGSIAIAPLGLAALAIGGFILLTKNR